MRTYLYKAVDSSGTVHTGEMISASRALALDSLSRQGLIPVSIEGGHDKRPAGGSKVSVRQLLRISPRRQVNSRELLSLTESLASLLTAGLTIDRALQISASLAGQTPAGRLSATLLQAVRAGRTLSGSFAASDQLLPQYFVSMVDAGEIGGSLPQTLHRLASLLRKQLEFRERIRSALIYPSLLAGVVVFTLVMLLAFVLPRFETLFAESEAPLPWSTRAVIAFGHTLTNYWWIGALGLAAAAAMFITSVKSTAGRYRFDRWWLNTRLNFKLPAALDTARWLRTVSTLSKNGLPLSAALRVARGTVTNQYLQASLGRILREVQAGEPLSMCLAREPGFPRVAAQFARVGEETGHLDELLLSAASVLEEESERTLERLLSLAVPLLTILMGLVVAGLISSVLIGLLSINDLAF